MASLKSFFGKLPKAEKSAPFQLRVISERRSRGAVCEGCDGTIQAGHKYIDFRFHPLQAQFGVVWGGQTHLHLNVDCVRAGIRNLGMQEKACRLVRSHNRRDNVIIKAITAKKAAKQEQEQKNG